MRIKLRFILFQAGGLVLIHSYRYGPRTLNVDTVQPSFVKIGKAELEKQTENEQMFTVLDG